MKASIDTVSARALAAAIAFLLAGCSDRSLLKDAQFNADPAGRSEDKGLVVVGLRVAREPVLHNWIRGDVAHHPVYHVTLGDITSDGKRGRVSRQIDICEGARALLNGALSDCVPSRTQYKLVTVPPGQYSLDSIRYQVERTIVTSSFLGNPAKPSQPVRLGGSVRNPASSFPVRAGEIVYAGDLDFDFAPQSLTPRLAVRRNDPAAQAALATYPGIVGQMVFRPVTGDGTP